MVNLVVFIFFCVKINGVLRLYILAWIAVPYLFLWSHFSAVPMYSFTSESVATLYLFSSADLRCRACSFTEYFAPKSLKTKVKSIGQLLCGHSLAVLFEGRVTHKVPGVILRHHVQFS